MKVESEKGEEESGEGFRGKVREEQGAGQQGRATKVAGVKA
jgi:hypothetical protein